MTARTKHRFFTSETPLPATLLGCEEELGYIDTVIAEVNRKLDAVVAKHPTGNLQEDTDWVARSRKLIAVFGQRRDRVLRWSEAMEIQARRDYADTLFRDDYMWIPENTAARRKGEEDGGTRPDLS